MSYKQSVVRFSAAMAMSMALSAHATPVTFGSLSSNDDGSTQIITDTLNQREWLRWDAVKTLTYAQTVAATGPGGLYEGWQISTNADAQLFIDALLGQGSDCDNGSNSCPVITQGNPGSLTGNTYISSIGGNYGGDQNLVWFLSDIGGGTRVGYISTCMSYCSQGQPYTLTVKLDDYGLISDVEATFPSLGPVGWLVYRDALDVPEPGTFALVALGLAALRFRKRNWRL